MHDDTAPQKRPESQLFKQSLPNQEAAAKPADAGAGATSSEAAKHNQFKLFLPRWFEPSLSHIPCKTAIFVGSPFSANAKIPIPLR